MKKALIVGGTSGIGLAIAVRLLQQGCEHLYIVGKDEVVKEDLPSDVRVSFFEKAEIYTLDLTHEDYSLFDEIQDIDTLVVSAGFGRACSFETLKEKEISNLIKCNELAVIQIIKKYYSYIHSNNDFFTLVLGSIAGHISSPLFSVYSASKAGLCRFVESINAELDGEGLSNRILDVSPGSLKGTSFNGGANKIDQLLPLASQIMEKMYSREVLYIPEYENIYREVIERYRTNPIEYGKHSYEYKMKSGRIKEAPQLVVGYLSGTFDLFHIGHLNLLRRAKEHCDYLIVGVHKDASHKGKETFVPFEERVEILKGCKYVDEVVESCKEDSDAWDKHHYDILFVGSDYKGTERFLNYEKYFSDKCVKIVYFPYTKETSSTQLREKLNKA